MSKVKVIDLIKYISSYGQDEIELNSIIEHFKDKPEEEKLFKPIDNEMFSAEEKDEVTPDLDYSLKNSNNFSNQEPNIKVPLYKANNTYYNEKTSEIVEEEISVPYSDIKDKDKEALKDIPSEMHKTLITIHTELDPTIRKKNKKDFWGLKLKKRDILTEYSSKIKSDYSKFKNDGDTFIVNSNNPSNYLKTDEFMSKIYVNPFVYKMFQKENEKLLWSQRIKMLESKISKLPEIFFDSSPASVIKARFGNSYCEGLFRILEHYFDRKIVRSIEELDNHIIEFISDIDTTNPIKCFIVNYIFNKFKGREYSENYTISFSNYITKNSRFENVDIQELIEKIVSEIKEKSGDNVYSYRVITLLIEKYLEF